MSNPFIYVFVRLDLPFGQLAVQSSHVILEATRAFLGNPEAVHPSFIILQVKDLDALHDTVDYLSERGINFTTFREPDRGNELTAVATGVIVSEDERNLFKDYRLLNYKSWATENIKKSLKRIIGF